MKHSIEEAKSLTPVLGGGGHGGLYLLDLFFCFIPFLLGFGLISLLVNLSMFIYISRDVTYWGGSSAIYQARPDVDGILGPVLL